MAFLLVDLHRNGVFWGDCSLANTLFRRDGDRIQAYLVDAETSEVHAQLSDGQREYDVEILVENVAFGLADLAAMQEAARPGRGDRRRERVRERYRAVWAELHDEPVLHAGDRQAIRARVRRLNDLGYSVDLALDPTTGDGLVRLRMHVTTRRFHAREIERRTRIRALEGQARLLLNDLNEYHAWLEWQAGQLDRPGRSRRALAARGLPADAGTDRRDGRAGPRPRPGVLRRPRAEVVPVGGGRLRRRGSTSPPRPTSTSAPRPGDARPTTANPSVALDLERIAAADRLAQCSCRRAANRAAEIRVTIGPMTSSTTSATDAVIRVDALRKTYGELVAVDGVSFEVAVG